MAASSAAGTLQSSLDEVHAAPAVPSSSKGSTDVIRVMLREQKRECATLHANPLFKEFRDKQKRSSRTVHGHAAPAPPVIEDLEAEGQARLIDFIKSAAAEREVAPAGVWANFGKPYACLGELQQLDSSAASLLPHLNRDDLHSSQQQRRPGPRSSTQGTQAGVAAATARSSTAEAAAAAEGGGSSGAGGSSAKDQETAKLHHHKTVVKYSTLDRLEASFPAAAVKQANARRKAAKAHPHKFFNKELAEADAADAAGSYGAHTLSCKQLPGHQLVQRHKAAVAAAAAHAEAAAAASMHAAGPGSLGAATAAVGAETIGSRSSTFITQRATAGSATLASQLAAAAADEGAAGVATSGPAGEEHAQQGTDSRQASEGGSGGGSSSSRSRGAKSNRLAIIGVCGGSAEQAASSAVALSRRSVLGASGTAGLSLAAGHRMSITSAAGAAGQATAAAAGGEVTAALCSSGQAATSRSHPPCFKTVTELTLQQPGNSSPVTGWHNDFVKVRHAGYTSLQSTLWPRSQARAAARGHTEGRAQLSNGLMESLDAVRRRLAPGWVAGTTPDNPYSTSKQHASAAAAGAEGPAAAGTRNIKPCEVELLEHFYDALCGLVERQRLSDPLSLFVVHQVKALLEGGTFLQPPLLQQLVERLADFVRSCGLLRYNRFALPLLAFIRKCVGVGQLELESMVAAAGISTVLFEHWGELAEAAAAAAGRLGHAETAGAAAAAAAAVDGSAAEVGSPTGSGRAAAAVLEGSCSSAARRSSRLASEAGVGAAAAAATVAPMPIDTAAAAAAADIQHAVQAAPASQRAAAAAAAAVPGAAGRCSSPGSKSVRVRVPGVAGHMELVLSPTGAGSMASTCADAAGGQMVPKLDLKHGTGSSSSGSTAAVPMDEVLPDLGEDGCGQPLSRRVRQLQGLQSWSGGCQQKQQQQQDGDGLSQLQVGDCDDLRQEDAAEGQEAGANP